MTDHNNQSIKLDNASELIETAQIKNLFRIINYDTKYFNDGSHIYVVSVYNDELTLKLTWIRNDETTELNYGAVVRVNWMNKRIFKRSSNIVNGVERVVKLNANEDLFSTVPKKWISNIKGFRFLAKTVAKMDIQIVQVIQHMLLDEKVFYCFLSLPYSELNSLNNKGGNFELTSINLQFALNGNYHEIYPTERCYLMAAVVIIGIVRNLDWMYDDTSNQHDQPKSNQKTLNLKAVQFMKQTISKYQIAFSKKHAVEFTRVLNNSSFQEKLTSYLW